MPPRRLRYGVGMARETGHNEEISVAVRPRSFIEDITLPLLSRARMYDPERKPRGLGKLRRKIGQAADEFVHGWLNVASTGVLTVRKADGSHGAIEFDAHQSAYLAFASRFFRGGYEPVETMFVDAMLARSRVFYDVGANWGYYSLLAATHPGFDGEVFSFDVSHRMNADLARMVDALKTKRVKVTGYGLSNRSRSVLTFGAQAAHLTTIAKTSGRGGGRGTSALVNRLDDIALPPPDLMKIDVEDHEREVFEGGRRTLREHRPLILFECRDGGNGGEAGKLLRSIGYDLYGLHRRGDDDSLLRLRPLDTNGSAPVAGPANLVAVPAGDEGRWFD